jgi:hypothetical protein
MKKFALDESNGSNKFTDSFAQSSTINNKQLEFLKACYQLENPGEIFDYLKNKGDLLAFLLKAVEKIDGIFADSMNLTMVKKSDPEIEDFDYLAVYINTSELSVSEARAKFKKFKYDWYFDHSDNLNGSIVFHVT